MTEKFKFNIMALAFALGIAWGIGMLAAGWLAITGWGVMFVETMSSFYIGYSPSIAGGITGAIWGFFDGGVTGLLTAIFYNLIVGRKKR